MLGIEFGCLGIAHPQVVVGYVMHMEMEREITTGRNTAANLPLEGKRVSGAVLCAVQCMPPLPSISL
jgi:hypothetical protein